jgi:GMP reductase
MSRYFGSKLTKIGYSLYDVTVVQAPIGSIEHRADVDPFVEICERKVYPIFVSPMSSVTDEKNYKIWIEHKLTPVVPRSIKQNITFDDRIKMAEETFVSISLQEADDLLNFQINKIKKKIYICIDIANGNLESLYEKCKKLKQKFDSKISIMTGNCANSKIYTYYAENGIDWMRVGIGIGSRCTTSCNTSIYTPPATLLDELNQMKIEWSKEHHGDIPTKIILDGGISNFDDIQKALALGADAVMSENIFARAEEACGEVRYAYNVENYSNGESISVEEYNNLDVEKKKNYKPFRDYYGMSTKRAQNIVNGTATRTSEGISRPVPVEYSIAKWADNMESYLRSAMTYTNSQNIKEFQNNTEVIILGGSGDLCYRK